MKSPWILPALGLALLLILYALAGLLQRDYRKPNAEILPADMARSPAAEPVAFHGGFPDRLVQRLPPEGVIPRGAEFFDYGPGEAESKRAGRELVNPYEDDAQVLARGKAVFTEFCAACHGLGGRGDGEVAKRGFTPPPAFQTAESRALPDGEIFHFITYGGPEGKDMPSLAGQIAPADRWKVIRYVRVLQETE
ncbi:MAG: c-type cytochrome [Planctomycetota bacterium]|jgi:mono/diheme cytochrome c family protein